MPIIHCGFGPRQNKSINQTAGLRRKILHELKVMEKADFHTMKP